MSNMSKSNNFVTLCLRGTSQVFFMENVLTGIFFFAAIIYASYVSEVWATTIGAFVGVIVATFVANIVNLDEDSVNQGLYGFNGILVGVALPTFIHNSPDLWFYIIIGSAASTIVTAT